MHNSLSRDRKHRQLPGARPSISLNNLKSGKLPNAVLTQRALSLPSLFSNKMNNGSRGGKRLFSFYYFKMKRTISALHFIYKKKKKKRKKKKKKISVPLILHFACFYFVFCCLFFVLHHVIIEIPYLPLFYFN
jgi:hypothetical protein